MPHVLFGPLHALAWLRTLAGCCRAAIAVLLLSLAVPAAAGAQASPADEPLPRSPLEQLAEYQGALGLTEDQMTRLEAIRRQLATSNEPFVERMMTLRTQWQRLRRARERGAQDVQANERLERLRANADRIRARIQRNNRTAMQAVNRMLTRAQRAQLRQLLEERQGRRGAPPAADPDADRR